MIKITAEQIISGIQSGKLKSMYTAEQYAKAIKKSDFNMTYTLTYLSELFKIPEVHIKNRIIDILEEK